MSEAKKGCALLEYIDEHTFVRFSQYAYTGDSVTAEQEILLDSSTIGTTPFIPNAALPNPIEGYDDKASPPAIISHGFGPVPEVAAEVGNDDYGWGSFSNSKKDKKKGKEAILRHTIAG